jgi:segregation and condensation protein A
MTYEVHLAAFEGPFDLLLQLIARRKVDVHEVDLADITADFIAHLGDLDQLDLETATRFLVVAATLIELKALRLLPEPDEDVEELLGEARDLLYARLLEYRAVRRAAAIVADRIQGFGDRYGRVGTLEPRFRRLTPEAPLPLDGAGLAALAAAALRPRPIPTIDLDHVHVAHLSIRDAAASLLRWLRADRTAELDDLVDGHSLADRIAFFLAVLELYKLDQVDLSQEGVRGPIAVRRRADGPPPSLAVVGGDEPPA